MNNHDLYLKQKRLLDTFLEHGAIDRKQYDKSLGDLKAKMKINDDSKKADPDYSRKVIDDLKALYCCCQHDDPIKGCSACPYKDDNPFSLCHYRKFDQNVFLQELLSQFPGEQANYFIAVIDKCSPCSMDGCDESCPFYEDSFEIHHEVFYRHVYDFLKSKGLYNEDGSVSEKGAGIRVSDTLALLKATKLTKDDWPKDRGGLL